jgi:hypothetical protein
VFAGPVTFAASKSQRESRQFNLIDVSQPLRPRRLFNQIQMLHRTDESTRRGGDGFDFQGDAAKSIKGCDLRLKLACMQSDVGIQL